MQSQDAFTIRYPRFNQQVSPQSSPSSNSRRSSAVKSTRRTRSSKLRQLNDQEPLQVQETEDTSIKDSEIFVRLMSGNEPVECRTLRWQLYQKSLRELDEIVAKTFQEMHSELIAQVVSFVETMCQNEEETFMQCALKLTGFV